jgi:hypothetical protein
LGHEPPVVDVRPQVVKYRASRASWERQAQRLRIAEAEESVFTDAPDCY